MYEEIEINGETIHFKSDVPFYETGVVVPKEDLEDTIDIMKKMEEYKDGSREN